MNRVLLLFTFIVYSQICFSQEKNTVQIIQKESKYRIELLAANTSNEVKKILVIIKGEGFRRSSFSPIIKNIKAQDTTHLTTLIKLKRVPNNFTYELFYDDNLEHQSVKRTDLSRKKKK